VILSILSQNVAFGQPCDWMELSQTYNDNILYGTYDDVIRFDITQCDSPNIDPVFLGSASSKEFSLLRILYITVELTAIEENQFIRAPNLETLNLKLNKIERIDKNAFVGLRKLKNLILRDNNIRSLPMGIFADLPMLYDLELQNNHLSSFDFSIFKQNPNLKYLRIGNNFITQVTTSQQYSSSLETIHMYSNSLKSLRMENLPYCPNLKILYLDNNQLTEFGFEGVKDKLPNLTGMTLQFNRFDCCTLRDKVRAMLLYMPNLLVAGDANFNDPEDLQRKSYCVKCEIPYQNEGNQFMEDIKSTSLSSLDYSY
jgi:BspA type Leucine rich repeat region (6 copies)